MFFITAGIPPAFSTSIIRLFPPGLILQIYGTSWLNLSNKSIVTSTPSTSFAIAGICNVVFVEPPNAKSTFIAFSNASWVNISDGLISFSNNVNIFLAEALAISTFLSLTACAVAHPGRLIPIVSVRQAIVFAVNNPAHEPAPGQAQRSNSYRSSSDILPDCVAPTASVTLIKSTVSPWNLPGIIGPPVITIAGIFNLAAAIIIPGTTLSQVGISINASNWCAIAILSTVFAIISRDGRE